MPADTRLPGYPAFLAAIFWHFWFWQHSGHTVRADLLDLVTCLIIADLAPPRSGAKSCEGRISSDGTMSISGELFGRGSHRDAGDFLHGARSGLRGSDAELHERFGKARLMCGRLWAASGAATGACILLRPDGGILLAAIALYLAILIWQGSGRQKDLVDCQLCIAAIMVLVIALAPLVPWTIRNFRTLHQFQPLAPRYATESEELSPADSIAGWKRGWRIMCQWRRFTGTCRGTRLMLGNCRRGQWIQRGNATLAPIADYNQTQQLTPQLDGRFAALAWNGFAPIRFDITSNCRPCVSRTCGCVPEPNCCRPTYAGGSLTTIRGGRRWRWHSGCSIWPTLLRARCGGSKALQRFGILDCWSDSCCCARRFSEQLRIPSRATRWSAIR